MRFLLSSRVLAGVVAAALALTPIAATPAFAGQDRTARTIATLLGLAVVGAIINEHRQDKKKKKKNKEKRKAQKKKTASKRYGDVHRHGATTHTHTQQRIEHDHRDARPPRRLEPRPLPRQVDQKLLPQDCFRSFKTRQGQVHMFGSRCLEQNYRFADRLPLSCEQRIRTENGRRSGFDARCLRRNGYSLARG